MRDSTIQRRTIGELTTHIGSGTTPRGGSAAYSKSGVPFIRSQNVRDGWLDLSDVAYITPEINAAMSRSVVQPGDVLLNITGASVGRSCVAPDNLAVANVNQHVCILRPKVDVLPGYLQAMLDLPETQRRIRDTAAGGSREGLNYQQVAALSVPLLALPEQAHLVGLRDLYGSILRRVDAVLAAKRELKRGLMHELLTGRRRFPEFAGTDVEMVRLGDYATELSERNRVCIGAERVMGVIKGAGLEPMRDHVRAADLSRYKVLPPDGFAYNPMRLNIGSIARSLLTEDCLVSPDYTVFQTDSQTLLPAYLDQLRRSSIWRQFVAVAGSGSVRVRIYFRDLAKMRIPLPSLPEQRRIATSLDALDREIALIEHLRDANESQKRAMIQRLLVGGLSAPNSTHSERELAHA